MDYQALLDALSAHADPGQARAMSAYMRDQFPYLGIPAPLRRRLSRPFLATGKKQPPDWRFINAILSYHSSIIAVACDIQPVQRQANHMPFAKRDSQAIFR
ncbi:MAG: DNA alkylation repair protein [Cardiobacteriaceae bacterium]|nr:DNA alkylation repair protein [Cardiobacteriaceae bacterium]